MPEWLVHPTACSRVYGCSSNTHRILASPPFSPPAHGLRRHLFDPPHLVRIDRSFFSVSSFITFFIMSSFCLQLFIDEVLIVLDLLAFFYSRFHCLFSSSKFQSQHLTIEQHLTDRRCSTTTVMMLTAHDLPELNFNNN